MMKHILLLLCSFLILGCLNNNKENSDKEIFENNRGESEIATPLKIQIKKDIPIHSYFKWMDSIVEEQNQMHNYAIDEYIIVHHNRWILDTLAHTDYYYLQEKGIFNEDSQALNVFREGQTLLIPDSLQIQKIRGVMENTYLDINIPEFKLRIIEDGKVIYKFPVRVGQDKKRYLKMAKGQVDMRTKPGIGTIVRVNKEPWFINPKDNRRYYKTNRDDKKVTSLPAIPWLETEIDGRRFGQLIHPTTNLATLSKAYSNGCIGLRESDAWIVYYYAPLETKVVIRYDLSGKDSDGKDIQFENIYPGYEDETYRKESIEAAFEAIDGKLTNVCDCDSLE